MTAGQLWYQEYLQGNHFKRQKRIAWRLSSKSCCICYLRYDLQPHHLSYKVINKWYEFLLLRYVCSVHHEKVQHFLGRRLRGTIALIGNYYSYKIFYTFTIGIYRLIKYLIYSFSIPKNRRRIIRYR